MVAQQFIQVHVGRPILVVKDIDRHNHMLHPFDATEFFLDGFRRSFARYLLIEYFSYMLRQYTPSKPPYQLRWNTQQF